MSFGSWIRNAAFITIGIGAFSILYVGLQDIDTQYVQDEQSEAAYSAQQQDITAKRIAKECTALDPLGRELCVREQLDSQHEAQRSQKDLNAQRTMARASVWLYVAALIQTVVGLGGIYYVARSLDKSAEAVTLTKQALIVDHRPWVRVDVDATAALYWLNEAAVEISLRIENVGKSAAIDVESEAQIVDFRGGDHIASLWSFIDANLKDYKAARFARHTILPSDPFVERFAATLSDKEIATARTDEDGTKYITPMVFVIVFYRSQVDNEIHYTAKAIEVSFDSKTLPREALREGEHLRATDIFLSVSLGSTIAT